MQKDICRGFIGTWWAKVLQDEELKLFWPLGRMKGRPGVNKQSGAMTISLSYQHIPYQGQDLSPIGLNVQDLTAHGARDADGE